jgi:alcohol dehydrogenase class IV
LLEKVLNSDLKDLITINRKKALPEKDFKGRIINGKLQEVSINIFDDNCFALQPMYKLSKETLGKWIEKTKEFVESGITGVYAENAFNTILPNLSVQEFSYEDDFIDEVDNPNDLERVSNEIRRFDFREQQIFEGLESLKTILEKEKFKKIMVVSDKVMFDKWPLKEMLERNNIPFVMFGDFTANPQFNDIVKGIELFNSEKCDFIVSIGGGSSIDTAKVIKLYSVIDYKNGIQSNYKYNPVKHLAIPTTAGTGSESTRYSVCYYDGKKQSITHDSLVPDYVILDPNLLMGLPLYQKKSTLMDALCQAIESYWSVNSTEESKKYSVESIKLILKNLDKYINNNDIETTAKMLKASNLAGKAINITQTTSAHAMSYKITSLFGTAHGHAVMLTLPFIWEHMENNLDSCTDARGKDYLKKTLEELKELVGGYNKLKEIYESLELERPKMNDEELNVLVNSVNPTRLKNNPEELTKEEIENIYKKSLKLKNN